MTLPARQYPSEAEAERAYRRRWILVPGVVVLLCVVVGLVYALGPWRTRAAVVSRSYPAGITRIELAGPDDVSLVGGGARTPILASWTTHWNYRKPTVRSTRDGDTLKLRLDCSYSVGVECSADVRLTVPAGVAVNVSSAAGDVRADGVTGDLTVGAGNGDVHLSDVTGTVDVRAAGGDVRLVGISGIVTARTNSGDLLADELYGKTARLSSSSGDVRAFFGTVPRNVTAQSNSGDVRVGVPRGSGPYQVRADTNSGDVRTDVNTGTSSAAVINATATSGDVTVMYLDDPDGRHDHRGPHHAPMPPGRPMPPKPPAPGRPG